VERRGGFSGLVMAAEEAADEEQELEYVGYTSELQVG
jgi:hypothetical protein